MKLKSLSRIALVVASLFSATIRAEEPGKGKTVRVLTVGNSFSQNATHYLGEIAKAAGGLSFAITFPGTPPSAFWYRPRPTTKLTSISPTNFGSFSNRKMLSASARRNICAASAIPAWMNSRANINAR